MLLLLSMVAAAAQPADRPQPPPDLEVVGRLLRNVGYESIDDPDDLLGHGWITAHFRITRAVHGRPPSRLITIRYLAHSYRPANSTMQLRLRADVNGTYTVCAEPGGEGLVCG
jgi:integration host factor subunit beta